MKRKLCLLLALLLTLSSTVSLAAAPVISNVVYQHSYFGHDGVFDHSTWKPVANFNINTPANITSTIHYSTGEYFNTAKINGSFANDLSTNAGNVTLTWNGLDTNDWHPANQRVYFLLDIFAQNDDGSTHASLDFSYRYQHSIEDHIVVGPEPAPVTEPLPSWTESLTKTYSHNTVCSFGPHFRNVSPELTDKWYMFTPLDLSQNGTQVYEVVGGNTYVVGTVAITVDNDNVTVVYDYAPGVWGYTEFFTFFHDYDEITTVNPEDIADKYEYATTYSITNDLNGDTSVLLFMCNTATFKSDNHALTYFYENIDERKSLRESMLNMIGKTEVSTPYRTK